MNIAVILLPPKVS